VDVSKLQSYEFKQLVLGLKEALESKQTEEAEIDEVATRLLYGLGFDSGDFSTVPREKFYSVSLQIPSTELELVSITLRTKIDVLVKYKGLSVLVIGEDKSSGNHPDRRDRGSSQTLKHALIAAVRNFLLRPTEESQVVFCIQYIGLSVQIIGEVFSAE